MLPKVYTLRGLASPTYFDVLSLDVFKTVTCNWIPCIFFQWSRHVSQNIPGSLLEEFCLSRPTLLSSRLNGPRRQSDFFPKTILLLEPEKNLPEATPGEYDGPFLFVVCCLANDCFSEKAGWEGRCFDEEPTCETTVRVLSLSSFSHTRSIPLL